MALIAMAVYDTEENKKSELTMRTAYSIIERINFDRHRLIIVDNNSCEKTKTFLQFLPEIEPEIKIITLEENIGTARAINKAWAFRRAGENAVKMDNDVVVHYDDWADEMDEYIKAEPKIGIIGLKRKDCWEYPGHENKEYKSILHLLPHTPGECWKVIEQVKHVIGTCQMYSSDLLDKIGYLYQPGLYGYDDVLASWRSHIAGFINCFIPHIKIDHIDSGETPHQGWKESHAGIYAKLISDIVDEYIKGTKSIYHAEY